MARTEFQTEPLGNVAWRKLTIGTTATQVILSPSRRTRSVILVPDQANAGTILWGDSTINTLNGVPIYSPVTLDLNLHLGRLYAVSASTGQVLWLGALVDEDGQ